MNFSSLNCTPSVATQSSLFFELQHENARAKLLTICKCSLSALSCDVPRNEF